VSKERIEQDRKEIRGSNLKIAVLKEKA